MKSYKNFVDGILNEVENCPKEWRKGQAVFNIVDRDFGVARTVQLFHGIDCFYDDEKIDDFLSACWTELKHMLNH